MDSTDNAVQLQAAAAHSSAWVAAACWSVEIGKSRAGAGPLVELVLAVQERGVGVADTAGGGAVSSAPSGWRRSPSGTCSSTGWRRSTRRRRCKTLDTVDATFGSAGVALDVPPTASPSSSSRQRRSALGSRHSAGSLCCCLPGRRHAPDSRGGDRPGGHRGRDVRRACPAASSSGRAPACSALSPSPLVSWPPTDRRRRRRPCGGRPGRLPDVSPASVRECGRRRRINQIVGLALTDRAPDAVAAEGPNDHPVPPSRPALARSPSSNQTKFPCASGIGQPARAARRPPAPAPRPARRPAGGVGSAASEAIAASWATADTPNGRAVAQRPRARGARPRSRPAGRPGRRPSRTCVGRPGSGAGATARRRPGPSRRGRTRGTPRRRRPGRLGHPRQERLELGLACTAGPVGLFGVQTITTAYGR